MFVGMFAGCGTNGQTPAGGNAGGSSTEDAADSDAADSDAGSTAEETQISIWHDGDEAIMAVMEGKVNDALASDGITVSFEKKSGLTDQIKLYGNDAENGPDLYVYAHDSLGTFVEMGVLAPITDVVDAGVYADMLPMTQEAGVYKGEQYMMPVYFETLLFMYNKELWEGEVPSTTEELYTYMQEHTDAGEGTYAVVNQHSTSYNVAPVINGFGG